jgi:DNA processing protein
MPAKSSTILKTDKEYPKLLKGIKEAPKKLYYKGNWSEEIFQNCLAVVGSRRLTSYGKRAAEQMVAEIASAGITIVSGFMYGGDAVAHKTALDFGGKTIAVMPCGIDRIHPAYQEDLYNQILNNNGLVISEYEGNMMPQLWTYPKRNRIVAGLSQAVLVIEAGLESGTLITADLAKKFGRKIFAIPGPITSEVSQGTLKLIKEGAEVATCAKDIIDFYKDSGFNFSAVASEPDGDRVKRKENLKPESGRDGLEQKIINELKIEAQDADDLARKLGTRVSELGTKLSLMQLKGQIQQEGNKYYVN